MTDRVALVEANIAYVQQGINLVDAIDDGAFVRTAAPVYASGVGPHLRHCIDHYAIFLAGFRDGAIDYDSMDRMTDYFVRLGVPGPFDCDPDLVSQRLQEAQLVVREHRGLIVGRRAAGRESPCRAVRRRGTGRARRPTC